MKKQLKLEVKEKQKYKKHRQKKSELTDSFGLTEKEIDFCTRYVAKHEATQSARDAGYDAPNIKKFAYLLLQQPKIRDYIIKLREEYEKTLEDRYRNTFYTKIKLLWETLDGLYKTFCETEDENVRVKAATAIRAVVSELNKMQGDLAPDKVLTASFDINTEIKKIKDIMPKFDRGY